MREKDGGDEEGRKGKGDDSRSGQTTTLFLAYFQTADALSCLATRGHEGLYSQQGCANTPCRLPLLCAEGGARVREWAVKWG